MVSKQSGARPQVSHMCAGEAQAQAETAETELGGGKGQTPVAPHVSPWGCPDPGSDWVS